MKQNNYYTPTELSELTGHTLDNVYRWLREGKVKADKVVGKVYLIPKNKETAEWIQKKKK